MFRNLERMLKEQDIVVLLALGRFDEGEWTYSSLSEWTGLSKSELHRSLKRSAGSHLFDSLSRRVRRAELLEFIAHGLRYVFPAVPGRTARGMPTAWDAPGLDEYMVVSDLEQFVWPHPRGTAHGRAIEPLHWAALEISAHDEVLYVQLALCDAIRLGGPRERRLATKLLRGEMYE